MGSKLFSETMIWKRAAIDLERCDTTATPKPAAVDETAPKPPAATEPGKAPPPANPTAPKGRDAKAKADSRPEKEVSKPGDCKRYVAQIGETISVPCEK
jgi:hypothetical protein